MPALLAMLVMTTVLLFGATPLAAQDEDPLPQRSNRPGLTPEESAAPNPEPEDVTGRWYSEFGIMEVEADGDSITGTYSCCDGTFKGKLNIKRLEIDWSDPIYGEGWAYLYWKPATRNLEGVFGKMEDMGIGGRWNAVRPPEAPEGGQRFTIEASHPRFETLHGEVFLALPETEGPVDGLLSAHYELVALEKPYRYVMLNEISGRRDGDRLELRWLDPVHLTRGEIVLERREDGAWEGTWVPHFLRDEVFPFALEPASAKPATEAPHG